MKFSRWYRAPELLVGDPAYGKEVTILMLILISMLIILLRERGDYAHAYDPAYDPAFDYARL